MKNVSKKRSQVKLRVLQRVISDFSIYCTVAGNKRVIGSIETIESQKDDYVTNQLQFEIFKINETLNERL